MVAVFLNLAFLLAFAAAGFALGIESPVGEYFPTWQSAAIFLPGFLFMGLFVLTIEAKFGSKGTWVRPTLTKFGFMSPHSLVFIQFVGLIFVAIASPALLVAVQSDTDLPINNAAIAFFSGGIGFILSAWIAYFASRIKSRTDGD